MAPRQSTGPNRVSSREFYRRTHLSVFTDSTPPHAEDPLAGWQVTLKIVPDTGASGELTFDSATLPASNYVLAAAVNAGLATIPPAVPDALDMLTAFDFTIFDGVDVPSDPGAGLLEIQLQASPDARGTFGLFIAGGPGLTEWSDETLSVHEFANVATSGLTRIASFRAVPEPASPVLALLLAALTPLARRRR